MMSMLLRHPRAAHAARSADERGQILALFGLSLFVMVAMAGLAVDAGGTFAQRRDQQIAADLAALAAANDYLINGNEAIAIARAEAVTAENGFHDWASTRRPWTSRSTRPTASRSRSMSIRRTRTRSWASSACPSLDVSTSASALAGFPDTGAGIGPFIFSIGAFEDDGTPKYQTNVDFGETNGDVPTAPMDLAWTNYGTGNVNSSEVSDIISGATSIDRQLDYGQYIGQENNGNHATLFGDVDTYLSGVDMPVAVVDNNGNFMGWAMFHVTSADQSSKHVRGYFLSSFTGARLQVTSCSHNACPRYLGAYVLKLSD